MELLDENGASVYKSNLTEPFLTPEENKTGVVPPFNSFSGHGDIKVTGRFVKEVFFDCSKITCMQNI